MEDLIYKLKQHNIRIDAVKGKLKLDIPANVDAHALIQEVTKHKSELISFITRVKGGTNFKVITPSPEQEHYVLSSAQRRMYVLYELDRNAIAYNMPEALVIEGKLDKQKLRKVFSMLVERHESLRTSFTVVNGEPRQKIHRNVEFALAYHEANAIEAKSIFRSFVRPFDLTEAPLFRAGLIKIAPDKHVLMVDMHHIVSDGISHEVLIQDFKALYYDHSPPDLDIQYKDFAEWQQAPEQQLIIAAQREFWLKQYTEEISALELPTDTTRPLVNMFRGDSVDFFLTEKETTLLRALAEKENVTVFILLLAIYNVFLSKLANQEDIIVGSSVGGRLHADLESVIGMFVNTLPLRNYPRHDMQFSEFLRTVRTNTLSCFENQAYPYEELINDLKVERSSGRNPLFNVFFAHQNTGPAFEIPGLQIRPFNGEFKISKFDLSLTAVETQKEIFFNFEYSTELFKQTTITKFVRYFKQIAASIIANPEVRLGDVDFLSKAEKEKLLGCLDNREVDFPKDKLIHQFFEEQVEAYAERIAVACEKNYITYRELNERSNRLAGLLRYEGVAPGDIVGLLIDRNIDTIIAMLAILKAGGAYLPMDVDYPEDRINYMIDDSQIKILVSSQEKTCKIKVINITTADTSFFSVTNPTRVNATSDLCYVIYTSGTTGNPKGVMVEHQNVVRLLFNNAFQFDFNADDTWTMFHSHCFDFSVWEMYGALLNGGKLVVIPKMTAKDPDIFLKLLQENKVTVLNQTPSAFYNLIAADAADRSAKLTLRYVICGGEALKPAKLRSWYQKYPGIKIINMYGITETTVHVTYKEIGLHEIACDSNSIGRPIPTLSAYIFDKSLKLVPQGVIGELFVGGDGVARGYLNRNDLTKQRFIANPYAPSEKLYRTGDLARLDGNEALEYHGRIDNQVQIKGFRIELGEIESKLLRHPLVKDAVVVDKQDSNGRVSLVAYFVSEDDCSIASLRSFLGAQLPDYMIPSYFSRLDTIPQTGNGKVDKKRLPAVTASEHQTYVAPANDLERKLSKIWSTVLKVDEPGVSGNFFTLGGDSILAIKLVNFVRRDLNANIGIADLFANPSIRSLAKYMGTTNLGVQSPGLPELIAKEFAENKDYIISKYLVAFQHNIEDVFPAADIQSGMLFHSFKEPPVYHDQMVHIVDYRDMDITLMKHALQRMVDKHAILRTGFYLIEDKLQQVVYKNVDLPMESYDLSTKTEPEQYHVVREYLLRDKANHFRLEQPCLWRLSIFALGQSKFCICLTFHHAIFDGWSDASFNTELHNIFISLQKQPDFLPASLQATYKDYVIRQMAAGKDIDTANYWKKELLGYKRYVFSGVEEKTNTFINYRDELSKELQGHLLTKAVELDLSVKHICFAAFIYTLKMFSYENDITVGLITNNRPAVEDGDKILGCFLNTVPIRVNIPHNTSWRSYLTCLNEKLIGLKRYENVSLAKIRELINEPSTTQNPITDIIFNYVDFHVYDQLKESGALNLNGLHHPELFTGLGQAIDNSLFSFAVDRTNGSFSLLLSHATDFIGEMAAKRFLACFNKVLTLIAANPDTPMRQEDVLHEEEIHNLLHRFNNTTYAFPSNRTLVDWFESQVKSTPRNTALVHRQVTVSYAGLNKKANQIAHALIRRGVKPGAVIGLMVDRSIEMIAGLLGILKSGAAYLPLDSAQPALRTLHMLKETKAAFLLTENNYKEPFNGDIECIDIHASDITAENTNNCAVPFTSSDLAYIIYTSGSTGKPKGVMINHRAVVNLIYGQKTVFNIVEQDKILQFSTIAFDASVEQIWLALLSGSSLILVDKDIIADQVRFNDFVVDNHITHLHATPSFLESIKLEDAPGLKRIVSGGEVCSATLVNRFNKTYKFFNEYGPTETTVTSIECCLNNDFAPDAPVYIGKPINNTFAYILNTNMELMLPGVTGELFIGGEGLAAGYVGDPVLSAQKFVSNPFRQGERMYKTGDFARWLPDGNLQFQGRIDEQVKIRGYRVELGEIEYQLRTYKNVIDAAVIMKGKENDQFLAAYLVTTAPVENERIKDYLSGKLPGYMVPSCYTFIHRLPLTPTGKLDRKALPDPEYMEQEYVAPHNDVERTLVKLWSEILKLNENQISASANFFDLGGHSLKTTSLSSAIQKVFKVEIPIVDIFNYPTLQALATRITDKNCQPKELSETLVLLKQDGDSADNLFLIHDGSGDIHAYVTLASTIEGHTVWGIKSAFLNDIAPKKQPIEVIVKGYVEIIRRKQPFGPYKIGGWSLGGTLAYEAAYQLEMAGEQVAYLVMIDTTLFGSPNENKDVAIHEEKEWVKSAMADKYHAVINTCKSVEELWMKTVNILEDDERVFGEIKGLLAPDTIRMIPNFNDLSPSLLIRYTNTIRGLQRCWNSYIPKGKVSAPLQYFKASESQLNVADLQEAFLSGIVIHEALGNHFSILQSPGVYPIANEIQQRLARCTKDVVGLSQ